MGPRELSLWTYDEVLAEVDRLRQTGYQPTGQWTLGQICRHLSYYIRGSLDGFDFMLPWPVRKLIGGPMLKRILTTRQVPAGGRTIPASVPAADVDEQAAVAEARQLIERLKANRDLLHPSPLFDELTPEQWEMLHVIHAAHHLAFLVPNQAR